MPAADPSRNVPSAWLTRALAFVCIALYLLAFYQTPLFYDEVAFRLSNARAHFDGAIQYSHFAQCLAAKPVPLLLQPAHVLFSAFDQVFGWSGLRLVPVAALLILVALLLQHGGTNRVALGITGGAFIGVAGVSAVLFRPEWVAYLHVAAILVTWRIARASPSTWAASGVALLHLAVICLSLFVHPQGLLLMPLSFLSLTVLLRRHRFFAMVVAVLMVGMGMQSIQLFHFTCAEDTALERAIAQTQGNGYALSESSNVVARVADRFSRYEKQFVFRGNPQAHSHPLPPTGGAKLLNVPVLVLVNLHLLALVAMALAVARLLWFAHGPALRRVGVRATLNAMVLDGRVLWFGAAALLIFYSFYDVAGFFYRAHFRNTLSVILLIIAFQYWQPTRARWFFKGWAVLAAFTCVASMIVGWAIIAPQQSKGFADIGVARKGDWVQEAHVDRLMQRCGIAADASRVIVDDATYTALKQHHRPIGFNYIWFGATLKGQELATPAAREDLIRLQRPSGYVVRCKALEPLGLMPQHRDGELCCKRY